MTDKLQHRRNQDVEPPVQPDRNLSPTDAPADQSRRSFSRRLGVTAPVLMTLASRPAFGGNCLSNMLSGNLSDPDRGECGPGWGPSSWVDPNGTINGMPTISAWQAAGYHYGTDPAVEPNLAPASCKDTSGQLLATASQDPACYIGGTTLSETPLASCYGAETRSMRQILLEDTGSPAWYCIAALLNARSPGFNYILTEDQVVGLCCGTIPLPPGYATLGSFLDSTWI